MKRYATTLTAIPLLLIACVVSGCTAPMYYVGKQTEVAVRTDANNQVVERITSNDTRWRYGLLLTPEGPATISFGEKTHFFLTDLHGKQTELRFLEKNDDNRTAWHVVKPLERTNGWVSVERRYDKKGHGDRSSVLWVIVFGGREIIRGRNIGISDRAQSDPYDYKHLSFGPGNRTFRWQTEHDSIAYSIVENDLSESTPSKQPDAKAN